MLSPIEEHWSRAIFIRGIFPIPPYRESQNIVSPICLIFEMIEEIFGGNLWKINLVIVHWTKFFLPIFLSSILVSVLCYKDMRIRLSGSRSWLIVAKLELIGKTEDNNGIDIEISEHDWDFRNVFIEGRVVLFSVCAGFRGRERSIFNLLRANVDETLPLGFFFFFLVNLHY